MPTFVSNTIGDRVHPFSRFIKESSAIEISLKINFGRLTFLFVAAFILVIVRQIVEYLSISNKLNGVRVALTDEIKPHF
jgi:hypothetical protein